MWHVTCCSSPHEFKFSVRGDEADAPLRLKFAELNTLVEGAVVNGNALTVLVTRPTHIIGSDHQMHKCLTTMATTTLTQEHIIC